MRPSLQHLIFDMDGVIIDSESLHYQAGFAAFQTLGFQIDYTVLHTQFKAHPDLKMFTLMLQSLGAQDPQIWIPQLIQAKAAAFHSLLPQASLIPGVLEFIDLAYRRYGSLGLVTSSTRIDQCRIFEQFNLNPWFKVIVTADDVQRFKPDPDPYRHALSQLQCDPERVLVFEDSPHGVQSAVEAGCRVVGLASSVPPRILISAGAERVFSTFKDVQEWIAD